jgi:uncharacterized protein (TIGR04255 family)
VEELPAIPPMFETFGLPQPSQISIGFVTGAPHNRFWFLSHNKDQLIQFQHDRLLHNWRKVDDEINEYPRFEKIIEKFSAELVLLEKYFDSIVSQKLNISQCEVSYINHIPADNTAIAPRADDWIRFLHFDECIPDDFSATFRQTIRGPDRSPQGRLICEAESVINTKGQQMIRLTLTARGAPSATDIPAALDFLNIGREKVVILFANVTTDSAHGRWERIR